MSTRIFWIESERIHGLAIMARPRGGEWLDEEIAAYKREGIETVISLLEPQEAAELDLQHEAARCEAAGIKFLNFPIPDRGTPPSITEARQWMGQIMREAMQGKKLAIHCRAGIGRSSMIAAALLSHYDYKTDAAFQLLAKARGLNVPDTEEQKQWVEGYERMLGNE